MKADQDPAQSDPRQVNHAPTSIAIRDLQPDDQPWIHDFLLTYNHSLRVVSRGTLHYVPQLPGLMATYNEIPSALLTYHVADLEFEVVTLHAAVQRQGLGARLLVLCN
jgi:hypothetical protein